MVACDWRDSVPESVTHGEKLAAITPKENGGGERFPNLAEKDAKSVEDNPAIQKQLLLRRAGSIFKQERASGVVNPSDPVP